MTRVRVRRAAIEMVTIVASILLAFGIQAWWDLRREEAHRTELLRQLRSDFASTHALLETAVGDARERSERAGRFASWARGSIELRPDSVASLAGAMFATSSFVPAIAHYEAARTSGEIGLVQSDSLLLLFYQFDVGRTLFTLMQSQAAEIFFTGPIQTIRLRFGTQRGFLETEDPVASGRDNVVVAAAQVTDVLQAAVAASLQQMSEASAEIVSELDRILAAR